MSRFKKLGILLAIFVIVCAATFILTQSEEKKEKIKNSEEVILEIQSDSVEILSWKYEEELSFHKDENSKWLYDEDEAFPVSDRKMTDLLSMFEEFGVSFIIEEVEDYSQYGLDHPVGSIHIETEEDTYDIELGDFSTMDSKRYVSIGDGNVYLVNTDPLETFNITADDVMLNDSALSYDTVEKISFEGNAAYSIQHQEDSGESLCEEDEYFTTGDEMLPLDTELVDEYLSTISNVDMSNYATYNATDEEIKTYGLDQPELTVTVEYTTEEDDGEVTEGSYVLHISRSAAEKEKNPIVELEEDDSEEESDDSDAEEYYGYIRVGESSIIYEISSANYVTLMKASYNDLRHQELFTGDFEDIESIDISMDGQEYTFTTKGKDEDKTWSYNGEEINVEEIETALTTLGVEAFTDEDVSGEEEIVVTLHLNHETIKKLEIGLYRHDGTNCIAVQNGKPVALIERAEMVELIEAVNAIVL